MASFICQNWTQCAVYIHAKWSPKSIKKKKYKSYTQRQYKASLEVPVTIKDAETLENRAQVQSSKGRHEWQPEIKEGVEGSDRGTKWASRKDRWNWKTIWRFLFEVVFNIVWRKGLEETAEFQWAKTRNRIFSTCSTSYPDCLLCPLLKMQVLLFLLHFLHICSHPHLS